MTADFFHGPGWVGFSSADAVEGDRIGETSRMIEKRKRMDDPRVMTHVSRRVQPLK